MTYDDWKTTPPAGEEWCQICGNRLTRVNYTRDLDGEREKEIIYGEWCDQCIINDLSQKGEW